MDDFRGQSLGFEGISVSPDNYDIILDSIECEWSETRRKPIFCTRNDIICYEFCVFTLYIVIGLSFTVEISVHQYGHSPVLQFMELEV